MGGQSGFGLEEVGTHLALRRTYPWSSIPDRSVRSKVITPTNAEVVEGDALRASLRVAGCGLSIGGWDGSGGPRTAVACLLMLCLRLDLSTCVR